MIKLSVVIITYNEEKNIRQCLQSVESIADEIVVLDSFSTDKTRQICETFNVRFFEHPFSGYVEQKNKALSFATYPHLLSVDADEVLSCELIKSVKKAKENWQVDGFYIKRMTNYCGCWIRHSGWYPDKKLRLWDTRKGRWDGMLIHEKVLLDKSATTALMEGDLLHYSYYTIDQHLDQIKKFTTIMALEKFQKGQYPGMISVVVNSGWKFVRSYIVQRGFLDGYFGFVISLLSAYATFLKYVKTRELFMNANTAR